MRRKTKQLMLILIRKPGVGIAAKNGQSESQRPDLAIHWLKWRESR